MVGRYGPHNPEETYVPHRCATERTTCSRICKRWPGDREVGRPDVTPIVDATAALH